MYKRVYQKIPTVEDLPYRSALASPTESAERDTLDKGWPLLFR
jgi:hypothetical protein